MIFWSRFRKDSNFLITYLATHLFAVIAMTVVGVEFGGFVRPSSVELNWQHLWLLPLGVVIAIWIPVLIHNCVHGNLRSYWLNLVLGELAGFYVLLSLASFELNHIMHHAHADSENDPHNPHNKNFLRFFFANNFGGTQVVLGRFLHFHCDSVQNRWRFRLAVALHFLNVIFRLLLWFLLLGPSLFLLFFIPSYLFQMFVFAHINFVTHETLPDGKIVIHNLDSNLYYKFVNFIGSGVYYHRNHHQPPQYYNPKTGANTGIWPVR